MAHSVKRISKYVWLATILIFAVPTFGSSATESVQPTSGSPRWAVKSWPWIAQECGWLACLDQPSGVPNGVPKFAAPDAACRYWLDSSQTETNPTKNSTLYDYVGTVMVNVTETAMVARCNLQYKGAGDPVYIMAYSFTPLAICPDTSYTFNPLSGRCERELLETYTLTLKPDRPSTEPSTDLGLTVTVENQDHQPPKSPVAVKISLKVDSKSGGHDHGDGTRPRGGIDGTKCESDETCKTISVGSGGSERITFNARDASGIHTVTATCDLCVNKTAESKVEVKVDGLEEIPASSFYKFIGATGKHSENHYLTPAAASVLRNLAISYQIEDKFWQLKKIRRGKKNPNGTLWTYTAPKPLHVNDASLEWGGKFDIHGRWAGDHQGHKRGVVVDIRANEINRNSGAVQIESFENFQKMARYYKANALIHCGKDRQARSAPDCVGSDGSQDDLRHFHVQLLGVDQ